MDYANVSITWKRIAELDGKSVAVTIPREQIESVCLRHGRQSERPQMQALFAGLLIAVGGYATFVVLSWLREGASILRIFSLVALMLPVGIYALRSALASGFYLEVTTADDRRKIAFAADATREGVENFVEAASDELGVRIVVEDLGDNPPAR